MNQTENTTKKSNKPIAVIRGSKALARVFKGENGKCVFIMNYSGAAKGKFVKNALGAIDLERMKTDSPLVALKKAVNVGSIALKAPLATA
jgi:hypothetical protein